MLDILGNVFGRSKKGNGAPDTRSPTASSSSDFSVVESDTNGQAKVVYPTILTDEVGIVMYHVKLHTNCSLFVVSLGLTHALTLYP